PPWHYVTRRAASRAVSQVWPYFLPGWAAASRTAATFGFQAANFHGVENLVLQQRGLSDETIVIGAHYHFAELGCGVVDNWTGVVAVRGYPGTVTLSGLSNEWQSIIHTTKDQTSKANPVSVDLGYRLALSMWLVIDAAPCSAYRKPLGTAAVP